MSKALYLIGAPGSGKSTVMGRLIQALGLRPGPEVRVCREATATQLLRGDRELAWMLGRFRDKFPGTDALGMAASRYLREWIEDGGEMPPLVLGEGVRLANVRFLLTLDVYRPLTVAYLEAPNGELQHRCIARDGDLNATYKAGAATRALKLAEDLELLGIPVMRINTMAFTADQSADLLAEKVTER